MLERYKKARIEYSKKKKKERHFEKKKIVDKENENTKRVLIFIRRKLSFKANNWTIKLGRVVEADEELCKEMDAMFQSIFLMEDTIPPTIMRWDGRGHRKHCYCYMKKIRLLMSLHLHEVHRPDAVSPYVLN